MCILLRMTSLEGILQKRDVTIESLQSDRFTFRGEFDGLQIIDNQSKHMQKNEITPDNLNQLFVEFGWVRGAVIKLLRQSYMDDRKVFRVKWKLVKPNPHLDTRRLALLNPFGVLAFPIVADILLEEK